MKKVHLTQNELGKFIAGNASSSEMERINKHLAACSECSHAVNFISGGSCLREILPSPFLKQRILKSHGSAVSSFDKTSKPLWRKRYAVISGAAGLCAAVLIVLFINLKYPGDDSAAGQVFSFSGKGSFSLTGSKESDRADVVSSGTYIKTGSGSAVIEIADVCSINILENSSFRIVRAEKRDSGREFLFSILNGSVISRFFHTGHVAYSFSTPHAVISSSGTELFIRSAESGTLLLVKSGRADLRTSDNSFSQTAEAGRKYTVTDKVVSGPAMDADYSMFTNPPDENNEKIITGEQKRRPSSPASNMRAAEKSEISETARPRREEDRHEILRGERRDVKENRRGLKDERRADKDRKKREKN